MKHLHNVRKSILTDFAQEMREAPYVLDTKLPASCVQNLFIEVQVEHKSDVPRAQNRIRSAAKKRGWSGKCSTSYGDHDEIWIRMTLTHLGWSDITLINDDMKVALVSLADADVPFTWFSGTLIVEDRRGIPPMDLLDCGFVETKPPTGCPASSRKGLTFWRWSPATAHDLRVERDTLKTMAKEQRKEIDSDPDSDDDLLVADEEDRSVEAVALTHAEERTRLEGLAIEAESKTGTAVVGNLDLANEIQALMDQNLLVPSIIDLSVGFDNLGPRKFRYESGLTNGQLQYILEKTQSSRWRVSMIRGHLELVPPASLALHADDFSDEEEAFEGCPIALLDNLRYIYYWRALDLDTVVIYGPSSVAQILAINPEWGVISVSSLQRDGSSWTRTIISRSPKTGVVPFVVADEQGAGSLVSWTSQLVVSGHLKEAPCSPHAVLMHRDLVGDRPVLASFGTVCMVKKEGALPSWAAHLWTQGISVCATAADGAFFVVNPHGLELPDMPNNKVQGSGVLQFRRTGPNSFMAIETWDPLRAAGYQVWPLVQAAREDIVYAKPGQVIKVIGN